MASVTLNLVWVNLMSSGEGVSGWSNNDKQWSVEIDAQVGTYANGRRRAISTAGLKRELPYTLVYVTLPTRDYLEAWLGQNVQLRDTRGQKWFGIFAGLSVREYKEPDRYDVAFTLQETTTAEGL